MAETNHITGKSLWVLIKSNIGTLIIIVGLVTNGLLINGKKAVDKYKSGISQDSLFTNQVDMKKDIKSIQTAQSLQNQDWTRFMAKDSIFKIQVSHGIIVLDTAVNRHFRLTNRTEERYKFLEDQLKKNSEFFNQIIPTQQSINIVSSMN